MPEIIIVKKTMITLNKNLPEVNLVFFPTAILPTDTKLNLTPLILKYFLKYQ